uniref:Uncharacterized protein n=1 Tax=Oryza brachyantha TaxID=4533 RepID=J3NBX9_ORYBR
EGESSELRERERGRFLKVFRRNEKIAELLITNKKDWKLQCKVNRLRMCVTLQASSSSDHCRLSIG